MAYSPVDVIALIIVIAIVAKIVILIVNPKSWMQFSKQVLSKPGLIRMVALVLAVVVMYFLLQEMTIVQIMGAGVFFGLLLVIGLITEADYLFKKYDSMIRRGTIWQEYWFYAAIWIILALWTVKELFF